MQGGVLMSEIMLITRVLISMSVEHILTPPIEKRQEIAIEIYEEISKSLHTLINDPGVEAQHSTIIELKSEQAIAQRAIEALGVKVA